MTITVRYSTQFKERCSIPLYWVASTQIELKSWSFLFPQGIANYVYCFFWKRVFVSRRTGWNFTRNSQSSRISVRAFYAHHFWVVTDYILLHLLCTHYIKYLCSCDDRMRFTSSEPISGGRWTTTNGTDIDSILEKHFTLCLDFDGNYLASDGCDVLGVLHVSTND